MRLNLALALLISYSHLARSAESLHHLKQETDDGCSQYSGVDARVHLTPKVVKYAVEINNFFTENTTININNGPVINIVNAPVNLSTIVFGTSTTTGTTVISGAEPSSASGAAGLQDALTNAAPATATPAASSSGPESGAAALNAAISVPDTNIPTSSVPAATGAAALNAALSVPAASVPASSGPAATGASALNAALGVAAANTSPGSVSTALSTVSIMVATSAATTQTIANFESFFIQIILANPVKKRAQLNHRIAAAASEDMAAIVQRQDTATDSMEFLGTNGTVVTNCSAAVLFDLNNGNLFDNQGEYSTNFGTSLNSNAGFEIFEPAATTESITENFSLSADMVVWTNPLFEQGFALFCVLNGYVFVVFDGIYPTGCLPASLAIISSDLVCLDNGKFSSSPASVSTPGRTTVPITSASSTGASGIQQAITLPSATTSSTPTRNNSPTSGSTSPTTTINSNTGGSTTSPTATINTTTTSALSTSTFPTSTLTTPTNNLSSIVSTTSGSSSTASVTFPTVTGNLNVTRSPFSNSTGTANVPTASGVRGSCGVSGSIVNVLLPALQNNVLFKSAIGIDGQLSLATCAAICATEPGCAFFNFDPTSINQCTVYSPLLDLQAVLAAASINLPADVLLGGALGVNGSGGFYVAACINLGLVPGLPIGLSKRMHVPIPPKPARGHH